MINIFKKKKKESPDYTKIKNSLKNLPVKWYRGLMIEMILQSKKSGCFRNDDIVNFVKMVELKKMIDK